MSNITQPKRTIDDEIQHVLQSLEKLEPEKESYEKAVKNLEMLCKAKSSMVEMEVKSRPTEEPKFRVSGDAVLVASTAIAQTVMILFHEQLNVVRTQAVNFILKGRL